MGIRPSKCSVPFLFPEKAINQKGWNGVHFTYHLGGDFDSGRHYHQEADSFLLQDFEGTPTLQQVEKDPGNLGEKCLPAPTCQRPW